jgi:hypothetical protein
MFIGILIAIMETELEAAVVGDVLAVVVVSVPVILLSIPTSVAVLLRITDNRFWLLSMVIPLTSIPFTILVPTPPKVDVPLNILLAKLSRNKSKSIVEEEEEEEEEKGIDDT